MPHIACCFLEVLEKAGKLSRALLKSPSARSKSQKGKERAEDSFLMVG